MHILAAFFDLNDDGVDIYDIGVALGALAILATALGWLWRRLRDELRDLILETTKPIQPGTNGGYSLPDLHRKVDNYRYEVRSLTERFDEHLDQHDADRRKRP